MKLKIAYTTTRRKPLLIDACSRPILDIWPIMSNPANVPRRTWSTVCRTVAFISLRCNPLRSVYGPFSASFSLTFSTPSWGLLMKNERVKTIRKNRRPSIIRDVGRPNRPMRPDVNGAIYTGARPKPLTTIPDISPLWSRSGTTSLRPALAMNNKTHCKTEDKTEKNVRPATEVQAGKRNPGRQGSMKQRERVSGQTCLKLSPGIMVRAKTAEASI